MRRREFILLGAFLAAGVALTWPRAAYLAGRLPATRDVSSYVWGFWWTARQTIRLGDPWSTRYLAAPVGTQLGFDTLMPLLGVVMTPVTLAFGPSATFNLLTIVTPGLACYAMFRAARLWLTGVAGPVAAGAFFGLSSMFAYQVWWHLDVAAGAALLPVVLEAAVRLRRAPSPHRGAALGLTLAAQLLVFQETAVVAVVLAAIVAGSRLLTDPSRAQLRAAGTGAAVATAVGAPQLAAMAQQFGAGGASAPAWSLAASYRQYTASLPGLFSPSPELRQHGLAPAVRAFGPSHLPALHDSLPTYGLVLTALAVAGLVVSWRRRELRLAALLWLGAAVLSLGPVLYVGTHAYVPFGQTWHHTRVSLLMPYTWLVRIPGLAAFREPVRLALTGLMGAAVLAGAFVDWLGRRSRPALVAVAVLAALEAGWSGVPGPPSMPTTFAALDRPIAADHSGSIVVDVPFGLRGGVPVYGGKIANAALVLATADGHPRAISYTSWEPAWTIARVQRHAFYTGLVAAQAGITVPPARVAAARADLHRLHVGWVLVWTRPAPALLRYLAQTHLTFRYQADHVLVFRPGGR